MSSRLIVAWVACWPILSLLPARVAADEKRADPQVALEVRLLTIADDCFERFAAAADIHFLKPGQTPQPTPELSGQAANPQFMAFLKESQLIQLMQAAQGNRHTNVMQTPRMVIDNGQTGTLDITETRFFLPGLKLDRDGGDIVVRPFQEPIKFGVQMTAQPQVSADRRSVNLALKLKLSELAEVRHIPIQATLQGPKGEQCPLQMFIEQPQVNGMTLDKTVSIPDGQTAVFAGMKKASECRNEYGPPILSKIPYLSRLCNNVGYSQVVQTLYVMVTPRIIVASEEEVKPATTTQNPSRRSVATKTREPEGALRLTSGIEAKMPACVRSPGQQTNLVAELLRAYDDACAAGNLDEAERLARAALILNPECFHRR